MGYGNSDRLDRIEAKVDEVVAQSAVMNAVQDDVRAMLAQMLPVLVRLSEDVGVLKGRSEGVPTARDFGRLKGRLDALEARQPVTLAYQTPPERRQG